MLTVESFRQELSYLNDKPQEKSYLLAVSGGADSMVLAFLFHHLKLNFEVAHVNYKLRAEASDFDEKLVENFCLKNNIPFHGYKITDKDDRPQHSIQEWARDIRYRFFREKMNERKLDYLVTAHHLNDQIETFFIHLSRGSGIKGLSGIPKNNHQILRPLLNFKKEEIYQFAHQEKIDFREDVTNTKNDYLRNQFRNLILPKIEDIQPHFIESAKKSIDYLNETKDFIEQQIEAILKKITLYQSEELLILDKNQLQKESAFVHYEILKRYGFYSSNEIKKIFTAETGSSFFSETYQLVINREKIEIIKREKAIKNDLEKKNIFAENLDDLEKYNYKISLSYFIDIDDNFRWEFDVEKLVFPLYLKKKEEGDFFYPEGMKGKKKVSKFYKEKKLSILAKQKTWILCDSEQILGIVPYRKDRRKIIKTNQTKNKLVITN